jgi:hypothetical protein
MTATWHFFGALCMLNNPTDCARIVFDQPRVIAAYTTRFDGHVPSSFRTEAECQAALRAALAHVAPLKVIPLKVMGSRWTQYGCTEK